MIAGWVSFAKGKVNIPELLIDANRNYNVLVIRVHLIRSTDYLPRSDVGGYVKSPLCRYFFERRHECFLHLRESNNILKQLQYARSLLPPEDTYLEHSLLKQSYPRTETTSYVNKLKIWVYRNYTSPSFDI